MSWLAAPPEVLISEEDISARVAELGGSIAADYEGRSPLLACILRGAVVFHADLIRQVSLPLTIDFISVSSYGSATKSSGEVRFIKDLESSIQGEDIILVEDIVDTGLTVTYLLEHLRARQPRSLRLCSLLSKPSRRKVEIDVDYLGFEIEDRFAVGYGLDLDQQYRNLPYVGVLE